MTLGRLLGALIPESPARTAGEQLAMAIGMHRLVDELPDQADPDPSTTDNHRED